MIQLVSEKLKESLLSFIRERMRFIDETELLNLTEKALLRDYYNETIKELKEGK